MSNIAELLTLGLYYLQITVLSGTETCLLKQTWSNAAKCCQRRGDNSSLPEISNVHTLQKVINDMSVANNSRSWINLRRETLTAWTWLHGLNSSLLDRSEAGCAAVHKVDNVTAKNCSTLFGQVCQVRDCADCSSLGHFSMACHAVVDNCFVYFCEDLNWQGSRRLCLNYGWDLAATSDHNVLDIMQVKSPCQTYWIGLRREEWIMGKSIPGPGSIQSVSLWGAGEPSDRGDCAVVYRDEDDMNLQVEDCQKEHDFICIKQDQVFTTPSNVNGRQSTVSPQGQRDVYLVAILAPIAIVLFIVAVSIIVFKVYKKRVMIQQEEDQPESMPLKRTDSGNLPDFQQTLASKLLRMNKKIDIWSFEEDNIWVAIDDIYTDVQWTRQGDSVKAEKYIGMFDKDTDNLRPEGIIVFGDAGSGKTTLTKRIAVDWSRVVMAQTEENAIEIHPRVKSCLSEFKYVIPLSLRDIKKGQCFKDIMRTQLSINSNTADNLFADLETVPEDCVLILDGYDEFIEERSSDIVNIVQGKFLAGVNIMVTSRPFVVKSSKLKDRKWDVTVHLHGLSPKSRDEYIDRFARCQCIELDSAKELKETVNSVDDLSEMSQCPAILLLICSLWHKSKNVGHTYTSFYKGFVKYMCLRYWKKYFPDRRNMSGEDIFRYFKAELLQIGKIAFNGLEKDHMQTVFSYKELPSEIDQTTCTWRLGFFKQDSGRMNMFCFHHRTVQEFFTALHIVHNIEKKKVKPLSSLIESEDRLRDSKVILKFVKGLGGKACGILVERALKGFSKQDQREITSFLLCFLDEQDFVTDVKLPKSLQIDIDPTHKTNSYIKYFSLPAEAVTELLINTPNLIYLRYLENLKAPNLNSLEVHRCDLSSFTADDLQSEGLDRILVSLNAREIMFSGFERGDSTLMEMLLVNADELYALETLKIHNCHFLENVYSQIARNLPNLSQLTTFSLCKCKIPEDQLGEIYIQLKNLENLKILDLSLIEASTKMQRVIADSLHYLFNLTNLLVCNFTERDSDGSLHLVAAVRKMKKPQKLHLGRFSLEDTSLEALTKNLSNLKTLQEVSIHSCPCNDTDVWANFIQALAQISDLTILDLSQNKLGQAALLSFNNVLTKLNKLHTLKLSGCGISTEEDLLGILSAVSKSPCVKYLSLSSNSLEGNLIKITSLPFSLAGLSELDVRDNRLDQILKDKIVRIMTPKEPKLKIIL